MSAKSAQNIQMCLTSVAPQTGNNITPTAIAALPGGSKGFSVTAPVGSLLVGDVVKFPQDIGFSSLAGKPFVVTKINGVTGFEVGNVTLGTGVLKNGSTIQHWVTSDMTCLCLSEFSVSIPTPSVIDVSTYCGPASLPSSKIEAGSASAAGYLDKDDLGYQGILAAWEDGIERILRVKLGTDNGYLIVPVTISGLGWTLPLDGAQGYSFTFTFASKPQHVFS